MANAWMRRRCKVAEKTWDAPLRGEAMMKKEGICESVDTSIYFPYLLL
jgi:hypothetical protein